MNYAFAFASFFQICEKVASCEISTNQFASTCFETNEWKEYTETYSMSIYIIIYTRFKWLRIFLLRKKQFLLENDVR